MTRKHDTWCRWFMWLAIALVALNFLFGLIVIKIVSSDRTIYVEEEVCYNETRPYSEGTILPNSYNYAASGWNDNFDRWEVVGYEPNFDAVDIELKKNNSIEIPPFNKSLVSYNPARGKFGFWNGNDFYTVTYRVYPHPPQKRCEIRKVPITLDQVKRGGGA